MMDNKTHKLSGRFCPFCLRGLWQHIESGFEFCPADPECDYEVREGSGQTAPLTQAERVERMLKNKQHEHTLMLKRAGELQGEIAELTRELAGSDNLHYPKQKFVSIELVEASDGPE